VTEIKRQFDLNPNLLIPNHPDRPDYDACIRISTDASLQEMIAPGALVMLSPIICGVGFGTRCVTGLLAGGIASGVQMAISASNTGGAWDNAKKYMSAGNMDSLIARLEPEVVDKSTGKVLTKKSQMFKAAVTGDTVGDPLKDTSGPALNILMKLMAIISVVFAPLFLAVNNGGGLIASFSSVGTITAATTNLIAVPGATVHVEAPQSTPAFVAAIFVAGAVVGMGGSFFASRVHSSSAPQVRAKTLHEPLLVCRADELDGTPLEGMGRRAVA